MIRGRIQSLGCVLLASSVAFGAEEMVSEVSATSVISAPAKSNPWHFSLDSEFYMNQKEQSEKKAEARVTSYHLAAIKYVADSTTKYKVVPAFEINSVPSELDKAKNVQDEINNGKTFGGARFSDPFISITKNVGSIFNSDTISNEVRYYLPLSEISQETGRVGVVRLDTQVPWAVGKWTFMYYLNPRLALESQASSQNQTSLSFREYALAAYDFSQGWAAYGMLGHQWLFKSENFFNNQKTVYVFEWGLTKTVNKNFAVTLYLDNIFVDGKEDIELFKEAKNDFVLYTSLNF